jgi:putative endonuclease
MLTRSMRSYWVYILASRPRGTLYVGVTRDLTRRVYQHREGLIEGFTSAHRVKMLVYCEQHAAAMAAIQREKISNTGRGSGRSIWSAHSIRIGAISGRTLRDSPIGLSCRQSAWTTGSSPVVTREGGGGPYVPRRCRQPSSAAKFGECRRNLRIGCEASFGGIAQAMFDAGTLLVGRLVENVFEAGIDIERNLGQLILRIRRPVLDALQRLAQQFGFHMRYYIEGSMQWLNNIAVEGDRIERVFAGRAQIGGRSIEEVRAEAMAEQSIKAMIDPKDIAALAVFLASDAGSRSAARCCRWIMTGSGPDRVECQDYACAD